MFRLTKIWNYAILVKFFTNNSLFPKIGGVNIMTTRLGSSNSAKNKASKRDASPPSAVLLMSGGIGKTNEASVLSTLRQIFDGRVVILRNDNDVTLFAQQGKPSTQIGRAHV